MQTVLPLWVCGWAWLNCAGWLLSAAGLLNATGYLLALVGGAAVFLFWCRSLPGADAHRFDWHLRFRRFRRPFPALFLLVAVLVLLGGMLHAPTNYDALTYRLPRLLHWLDAGYWHWIPTLNQRMNYSAPAWEWTAAPQLALLHSDRGLFFINVFGFLLLPGLFFSVFTQLGVKRRVAWAWMWLLPLAYGYVTQAGSIGNDLTGAVFCLASVHYGLRARQSGRLGDVWLCGLAAALMTGNKLSNLPLLLPCLVAVWPALPRLRRHLVGSTAVLAVAALVSSAPTMVLNQFNAGSWNGDPQNLDQMQLRNPAAGWLGNGLLVAEQTFIPPVLPEARPLSQMINNSLPDWLVRAFPRLEKNRLNEFPGEEGAGLGLGVGLPLLLVVMASLGGLPRGGWRNGLKLFPPVTLAAWVAALVFMARLGSEAGPRLMLPYYPLMIVPCLLLSAQARLLQFRPWRIFLAIAALGVLPILVLSVNRPLWPAQTVSARLAQTHPENRILKRLAETYATYARRNDVLAPVRLQLPADAREIGFIAGANDTDYSLWRPFGERSVLHLRHPAFDFLHQPGRAGWVVIKENAWPDFCPVPLDRWAADHHANLVCRIPVTTLVSWGAENWCVLRLDPGPGSR
jgi:hypothetical protein